MKKITHKCACGAEAVFEDSGRDQDKLIIIHKFSHQRGDYREEGLLVEKQAYEWLASHAACRQARPEPQTKEIGPNDLVFCDKCKDLCLRSELMMVYQDYTGKQLFNCDKCFPRVNPKPDPDECAEARAESLAGDHRETKEKAKEYAKWLANDASVPCLIYPCRVGGEDHWHVEKVIPDLIVFPSVSFMAQEIESARQQERERIAKDIGARKLREKKERDATKGYEPLYFTDGFIEGLKWAEQVANGTINLEEA